MRIAQPRGAKGSLKWIQILINEQPNIINKLLGQEEVTWVSPLKDDDYAEYRDADFLTMLGLHHCSSELKKFWPRGGPQWDALGKTHNRYFLIEAKANIPEINSSCAAKSEKSIAMIEAALQQTREHLGVTGSGNWLSDYYQYANRLAHQYFLRQLCGVEADMVFVYFCNDESHVPTSVDDWKEALVLQKQSMNLFHVDHLYELFVDCTDLQD